MNTTVVPVAEYTVTKPTTWNASASLKTRITDKADGNYYIEEGTTTKVNYIDATTTISPVELTVTAKEGTWEYGSTVKDFYATISGWVGDDILTTTEFKTGSTVEGFGTLIVDVNGATSVGDNPTGLLASGLTNTNYTYNYVAGMLHITKGTIHAKVALTEPKIYGEAPVYHLVHKSGLPAEQVANFDAIVNYDNTQTLYTCEEAIKAAKDYTIHYTGTATSLNYNVVVDDGTITIGQRPIQLKARNQSINLGNSEEFNAVASATTVEIVSGGFATAYSETYSDLNITLTPATFKVGPNDINISAVNANYLITYSDTKGVLTITGAGAMTLNSVDDAYDDIVTYGGQLKNVTLNLNRNQTIGGAARTWNAQKFHMLCLPFEVTLAELAEQLGYVIVNTVDASKAQGDKVYLALEWNSIPANTPFFVRTAIDIDATTGKDLTFAGATIEAPSTAYPFVNAGNGIKLVGAYNTFEINKANSNGKYLFYHNDGKTHNITSETGKWNIVPFDAYIDVKEAPVSARDIVFVFEDVDGGTTSIKAVEFMNNADSNDGWYNLNGVKMQNAPTEKGIYINNGKKIVIK